ncbi:MAG: hypothetical protein IPL87_01135 [Candidatus Moraniibacteriota bacterium]|nr:MAG: hypothetical protein IPL87_01135 [Candidatus Moranbacteria bacterium]
MSNPKKIDGVKNQNEAKRELLKIKEQAKTISPIKLMQAQSEKFKLWTSLFLDKSNKAYFGNRVRCALAVYDTDDYATAAKIGSQNYKKLQLLNNAVLEADGFGILEAMRLGRKKVEEGDYDDYDRFMERLGIFEPKPMEKKLELVNTFDFTKLGEMILKSRRERGLIE